MNTSLRLREGRFLERALAICLIATALAFEACEGGRAQGRREHGQAGRFDSYILALSWAPAFCAEASNNRSYRECDARRHLGFTVHGLWPERPGGGVLEYCGRVPPVSYAIVEDMLSIMPDRELIQHEWRAHGSCSGMSAGEYFGAIRAAYSRVNIPRAFETPRRDMRSRPAEIERLFQEAGGTAASDSVRVACREGDLTEVRICLSRNLQPIPCSNQVRECRAASVSVRGIP